MARAEGHRFEALYVLALTTGLRIGELLGLRWSDIDLDTHRLRVSRQVQRGNAGTSEGLIFTGPKAAGRRTVDLPTRTIEALKRHRQGPSRREKLEAGGAYQDNALVFATSLGTPFGPETVTQRSFKPLLRRTVLPEIRFHDLRHTYATLLLVRGVRPTYVQRALGHASVKMTLDRYPHWMPSMGRATVCQRVSLPALDREASNTTVTPPEERLLAECGVYGLRLGLSKRLLGRQTRPGGPTPVNFILMCAADSIRMRPENL